MRVKLLIGLVLVIASLAALAGAQSASQHWLLFFIYLAAVLVSSRDESLPTQKRQ